MEKLPLKIFNDEMHSLLGFVVKRCKPFKKFNPPEILVLVKKGRVTQGGFLATCHSTRLNDKEIFIRFQGVKIRYLIHFFFPRFMALNPEERLETLIHELFHIDPGFSGKMSPLGHGDRFDNLVKGQVSYLMTQFPEILQLSALKEPLEAFKCFRFKNPGPKFGNPKLWTESNLSWSKGSH